MKEGVYMKKGKVLKIVIVICILIFIITMAFSIYKFGVINPISSGIGMLRVLIADTDYVVVQRFPYRVVFANPEGGQDTLDSYMQERGFEKVEDMRMGSILVYRKGDMIEKLNYKVNGYYAMWSWQ